jgi:hypothetical protein
LAVELLVFSSIAPRRSGSSPSHPWSSPSGGVDGALISPKFLAFSCLHDLHVGVAIVLAIEESLELGCWPDRIAPMSAADWRA